MTVHVLPATVCYHTSCEGIYAGSCEPSRVGSAVHLGALRLDALIYTNSFRPAEAGAEGGARSRYAGLHWYYQGARAWACPQH